MHRAQDEAFRCSGIPEEVVARHERAMERLRAVTQAMLRDLRMLAGQGS